LMAIKPHRSPSHRAQVSMLTEAWRQDGCCGSACALLRSTPGWRP
jgi:hypothetical protein